MLARLISSLWRSRRTASSLCSEGGALFRAGKWAASATLFERALAREPDCVPAHAGLGAALRQLGEPERALPHLVRAADADPAAKGLNLMVAQLTLRSGQAGEARNRLARTAAAHPNDADLRHHLAIAMREAGDEDGAIEQLERLAREHPRHAAGLETLAGMLRDAGHIKEAISLYERIAALRPDVPSVWSALLFHHQYLRHDRAALFRRHQEWGRRFAPGRPRKVQRRDKDPDRPLTVGYVSADFNASSAVQFIEPILRGHDRSAFRIVCYAASSRRDPVTMRLREHAVLWREIDGVDDQAAIALVKADAVDILVDLNGHTRGGRLGLFAQRAAPVQVTYLGYGATSGVAAMDYRVTDECIDPAGTAEPYYVERLVRMPQTMWCFAPPAGAPAVGALPAANSEGVTFGSCNNFSKVSAECLDLWARLLSGLPGARLLFVGVPAGRARGRVLGAFERHGVDRSRLVFHGRVDFQRYLALHGQLDIALDTFPYTGGATTCNALWMGVPVLTLEGEGVLERSGKSLLRAAGLDNWVARSEDDYLARAHAFATGLPALGALRANLRARVAASALCAAGEFVRALESAYRGMWSAWCRSA
jgi:protein O-GlcNAc transferase